MNTKEFKVWLWIARHLPHNLVYAAGIVILAHGTTGQYGNTIVPELTMGEAMTRWGDK